MAKQLFFDDNKLFGKDNLERKYGVPELTAVYYDGVCSTDYCSAQVFRLDDGKYRMLYFGGSPEYSGLRVFAAISDDGIHFSPEQLFLSADGYPHEVMRLPGGCEVASIVEDTRCQIPQERYKLLMSALAWNDLTVCDDIYTSPDLLHWTKKEGVSWGNGTEPLASVFYNEHKQVYTIVERPFWGVRCAGYKETKDWQNFTEFNYCMNVDSLDERLCEVYGMYAFAYEGMYIGLPHMYRNLNSELNAKYKNGTIDTQLAYSYDGRYWRRSLREPFITGVAPATLNGKHYNMVWVSRILQKENGEILIYATGTELEHGPGFSNPGKGRVFVFRLREDGFISLRTENKKEQSSLATREKVWHGGEVHWNLQAKKATMAVYVTDETEQPEGGNNALGVARPLQGYSHEDCIPFEGDSTDWIPQFASGKTVDQLAGQTLVFELKFEMGEVFSVSGNCTEVYNTQAARYRKFGVLPQ